MTKAVIPHLGLVFAGWGIVTAVGPPVRAMLDTGDPEVFVAPTKTNRVRMDPVGGQRLLERLRRDVAPSPASEPRPMPDSFNDRVEQLIAEARSNGRQPITAEDLEMYRKRAIFGEMAAIVHGSNGPDYSYAFRHGRMEAQEMLEMLAERMPEHATDPYFPVMLYHCLVRQDPGRAEPLLAGLPDRERARQHDTLLSGSQPVFSAPVPPAPVPRAAVVTQSSGPIFYAENPILAPDPEFAMALLANIPWQRVPYRRYDHKWVWNAGARPYGSPGHRDYMAWLKSLPPGQDRDMAIERVLAHSPSGTEHPETSGSR
jgi:hypothetical protein